MLSGPRLAKSYVSNYLACDLPPRLLSYRNHWNLSRSQLPEPVKYLSYEPFALDVWPTIITMVINTRSITRSDYEYDTDPNFRVTYEMRTYIWTRDVGAERVTEQRDNLTTVVREALLDGPSLSTYDSSVPCYPKIDEGTLREEFSDLTLIKGDRLLAGAYIAYDLSLEEVVDSTPVGVMLSAEAVVEKMPITANAPTRLIATAGTETVTLSWLESSWFGGVYNITGYNVQKSTDGGSTWSTVFANTGTSTPGVIVEDLTNDVSYIFRVAAVNAAGIGAYSASSNAAVPKA